MVGRKQLIERIRHFFARLERRHELQQVILFGSLAEGSFGPDSDVDLILVSPKFEGKKFFKRPGDIHLAWDLGVPVDLLCFTPKEFEERRHGVNIISHALAHGVQIL